MPFGMDDQTESLPVGVRFNSGKTPVSMLLEAKEALLGCSEVMKFGAKKYARSNWRRGLPLTGISDSLSRHLLAFLSGEDNDPETGLPHVDHILCNAIFLSQNYHTRKDMDDRPYKDGQFVEELTVPKQEEPEEVITDRPGDTGGCFTGTAAIGEALRR